MFRLDHEIGDAGRIKMAPHMRIGVIMGFAELDHDDDETLCLRPLDHVHQIWPQLSFGYILVGQGETI